MESLSFTKIDYAIFGLMMGVSTLIGVYYGFLSKKKQNNTAEYLLGSKSMGVIPVAISLTATHISAGTMLGVPAEMYKYGIQYWACVISGIVVTLALVYIYLPVFHDAQTLSCYGYLEKRFNHSVRSFASFLYFLYVLVTCPLYVYTPALAFSQVSGINLHVITPIICCVCIFYTTFGGLRAVVWTDTIQFSTMIGAVLIVMVLGTLQVGGVMNIFRIAEEGGRLMWFNFDTDPTIRTSFWMVSIGLTTMWVSSVGVTPECVQRFVAIPKKSDAIKAAWIFGIGHIIVKLISVYNGLLIFSRYEKCDPIFEGNVEKYDQIFPYFVMDVARSIPGLPGLFIVGALCAALSTLSSCLNSLSGTVYEDFIKPFFPKASEKQASNTMKTLVLLTGLVCFLAVFLIEKLGGIFSIGIAFTGVFSGIFLGLFTMGMISSRFNAKGALWGSLISLLIVGFIAVGAQISIFDEKLRYPSLPFDVEECDRLDQSNITDTRVLNSHYYTVDGDAEVSDIPYIFRISPMYYSIIGSVLVAVIGYLISIFTGGEETIDEKLLAPFLRDNYVKTRKENLMKKNLDNFIEEMKVLRQQEKC